MPSGQSTGKSSGQSRIERVLLASVVLIYGLLLVFDPAGASQALARSWSIAVTIAPILVVVTVFISLSNYALSREAIATYVGAESGGTGYLIAIVAGIASHGPVYVWYTLLADLRERGMRDGLIAVFLYNRAIKVPLLPLFVYYFPLRYAAVLLTTMVIASLLQAVAIERLVPEDSRREPSTS